MKPFFPHKMGGKRNGIPSHRESSLKYRNMNFLSTRRKKKMDVLRRCIDMCV